MKEEFLEKHDFLIGMFWMAIIISIMLFIATYCEKNFVEEKTCIIIDAVYDPTYSTELFCENGDNISTTGGIRYEIGDKVNYR